MLARHTAVLIALGFLPFGLTTASAQATRPPGEVPYLNYPQVVPGHPVGEPAPSVNTPSANTPAANAPAPGPRPSGNVPAPPPRPLSPQETRKLKDEELAAIQADQKAAMENEARLKQEIESIGNDKRKLNEQLIETAARVRALEEEVGRTEDRLRPLDEREQALRRSLDGRRGTIAEVLAALQRIGRQPPAALMVQPEDALQSLRSALLLGAVLPEMRQEADALVADLSELALLRKGIAEERARLDSDLKTLATETPRLTLLIAVRQRQQAEIEAALAAERERVAQLGRQAQDLKDLVAKLDQGPDGQGGRGTARPGSRPDLGNLKGAGRLTPAIAFAAAKKRLPLPVNGVKIRAFGAADGLGGTEKGLSLATRPGAQVTAPCDGWVVYAGPFRNYGQLLILNAGGGYHVLLAGMERISVDLGQFVVTGEPVAVMGARVQAAATLKTGSGQPVLYVEFRKDGIPVDPSPWWATSEVEKVRG